MSKSAARSLWVRYRQRTARRTIADCLHRWSQICVPSCAQPVLPARRGAKRCRGIGFVPHGNGRPEHWLPCQIKSYGPGIRIAAYHQTKDLKTLKHPANADRSLELNSSQGFLLKPFNSPSRPVLTCTVSVSPVTHRQSDQAAAPAFVASGTSTSFPVVTS
jgi:hypothetical protein